jgi:hypothetical protein
MLAALPILLIAIVWMFWSGASVGGFATAILSGITLVGNAYSAIMKLYIEGNGIELTAQNGKAMGMASGSVMFAATLVLLTLTLLAFRQNRVQSLFFACACLGFLGVSLKDVHLHDFGLFPGVLLLIFAFWEMYSGLGMLIYQVHGKELFPFLDLARE